MNAILWIIATYLIGSISFAIVLSKQFNMADPRSYGSNNPGATNMLRSGRKGIALLTLLGDALKGFMPVFLAKSLTDLPASPLCAIALAAFIGHLYPIFFQFKGGKGVATFFGAILALSPSTGSIALGVWLIVALTSRYSSLASLIASVIACAALFIEWGGWGGWVVFISIMVFLLFWRHRTNINNLCLGNESKLFTST